MDKLQKLGLAIAKFFERQRMTRGWLWQLRCYFIKDKELRQWARRKDTPPEFR